MEKTTPSLLYCQADIRQRERRLSKGTQEDKTISTVRLGLDKIETKRHGTVRSFTYTTILRLCGTKVISIKRKTDTALRV